MADFGYSNRARAVEEARSDMHSASSALSNRWDESDPKTQRWKVAVERFRAAIDGAYAHTLGDYARGRVTVSDVDTSDILDFLEADPMFFRSGYMKERVLIALKQRELTGRETDRLQTIILEVIAKADRRREMRHYCRTAACVDGQRFRTELEKLECSDNEQVALRANWVLAALDGQFEEIAWKSRSMSVGERDAFATARISRKT